MIINKVEYTTDHDHISNVLREKWWNLPALKSMEDSMALFATPRKTLKTLFGKQLTTKVYEYKNWIWSFTNDTKTVTIYMFNDKRGQSYAIRNGYTQDAIEMDAIPLLEEIINALR